MVVTELINVFEWEGREAIRGTNVTFTKFTISFFFDHKIKSEISKIGRARVQKRWAPILKHLLCERIQQGGIDLRGQIIQ